MKLFTNTQSGTGSQPALFLDRDGVINFDKGYVYKPENFDFFPEIFDLISFANERNYLVIIVTNQSGIGRGLYTEKQFCELMSWMVDGFKEKNITIDGVFYSPFHPKYAKGKYLLKENTRKPGAGMFEEAFKAFKIKKENSIMIGDKITDIEAGKLAGIKNNLLLTNNMTKSNKFYISRSIKTIQSLSNAKDFIK